MKRTFEIELTTDEIAEAFANLPSDRQVDVLVAVALKMGAWGSYRFDMQNIKIAEELRQAGGVAEAMIEAWADPPSSDTSGIAGEGEGR